MRPNKAEDDPPKTQIVTAAKDEERITPLLAAFIVFGAIALVVGLIHLAGGRP